MSSWSDTYSTTFRTLTQDEIDAFEAEFRAARYEADKLVPTEEELIRAIRGMGPDYVAGRLKYTPGTAHILEKVRSNRRRDIEEDQRRIAATYAGEHGCRYCVGTGSLIYGLHDGESVDELLFHRVNGYRCPTEARYCACAKGRKMALAAFSSMSLADREAYLKQSQIVINQIVKYRRENRVLNEVEAEANGNRISKAVV